VDEFGRGARGVREVEAFYARVRWWELLGVLQGAGCGGDAARHVPSETLYGSLEALMRSDAEHAREVWASDARDPVVRAWTAAMGTQNDARLRALAADVLTDPKCAALQLPLPLDEASADAGAWRIVLNCVRDRETAVAARSVSFLQRMARSNPQAFSEAAMLVDYLVSVLEDDKASSAEAVLRALDICFALLRAARSSSYYNSQLGQIELATRACIVRGVQSSDILARLGFLELLASWWNEDGADVGFAPWNASESSQERGESLSTVLLACLHAALDECAGSELVAAGVVRVISRSTFATSEHRNLLELLAVLGSILTRGLRPSASLSSAVVAAVSSLCAQSVELAQAFVEGPAFQRVCDGFMSGARATNSLRESTLEGIAHVISAADSSERVSRAWFVRMDSARDERRVVEGLVRLVAVPFEHTQCAALSVLHASVRFSWAIALFARSPGWAAAVCVDDDVTDALPYAVYTRKVQLCATVLRSHSRDSLAAAGFDRAQLLRLTASAENPAGVSRATAPRVDIATR